MGISGGPLSSASYPKHDYQINIMRQISRNGKQQISSRFQNQQEVLASSYESGVRVTTRPPDAEKLREQCLIAISCLWRIPSGIENKPLSGQLELD